MLTAKLFTNGRSQAVRLPKSCRFKGKDVYIKKFDEIVILVPRDEDKWRLLVHSLDKFSDDFMISRDEPPVQERENL